MAEETLLTAARRAVRDFNIDNDRHGGLISVELQKTIETLTQQVGKAERAEKEKSNVVSLPQNKLFQERVQQWVLECFGEAMMKDVSQRCQRFLEEALELVQSLDFSEEDAHTLVRYVFGRPPGEPGQEIGGSTVTLAALCASIQKDFLMEAEREYQRITQPEVMAKIREKQSTKPQGSPLPGKTPDEPKIQKFVTHDGTITVNKVGE